MANIQNGLALEMLSEIKENNYSENVRVHIEPLITDTERFIQLWNYCNRKYPHLAEEYCKVLTNLRGREICPFYRVQYANESITYFQEEFNYSREQAINDSIEEIELQLKNEYKEQNYSLRFYKEPIYNNPFEASEVLLLHKVRAYLYNIDKKHPPSSPDLFRIKSLSTILVNAGLINSLFSDSFITALSGRYIPNPIVWQGSQILLIHLIEKSIEYNLLSIETGDKFDFIIRNFIPDKNKPKNELDRFVRRNLMTAYSGQSVTNDNEIDKFFNKISKPVNICYTNL